MPTELNAICIDGEKFYFNWSYDIDNFIGDGIYWLQIYDERLNLIYDKPFASSMGMIEKALIFKIIRNEFISYRGSVL